ncbi:hypothetical protein JCM11491_000609, partial [Sporobolomyces phaffii]
MDSDRPQSPPTKTVSFAAAHSTSSFSPTDPLPLAAGAPAAAAAPPPPSSPLPTTEPDMSSPATATTTTTRPSGPKRRRSSIKQGVQMPYKPDPKLYTHPDPLLRRVRVRNGFGTPVALTEAFPTRDVKVVLFFFGATWRASSREPFDLVQNAQRRYPHQCKVVFVSVDETKRAYDENTRGKNYLAMEWNDGSNLGAPDPVGEEEEDEGRGAPPLEPFLLAGDADLEEDTATDSATPDSLYLRPYSRVHLCDKWHVLAVPTLVVYHVPSREVLTYHARFDLLKDHHLERTWDKWSRGEKITFGVS